FFLQAGAFQNAPDADSLRARLALLGIEARIQTATLPDKGEWHRVRVGPYTSVEELGRTRETLKQNGVETILIKVRE
ncbi:MAG: SPOR domain-containing protein, partial [Burkholderiales bacterium]